MQVLRMMAGRRTMTLLSSRSRSLLVFRHCGAIAALSTRPLITPLEKKQPNNWRPPTPPLAVQKKTAKPQKETKPIPKLDSSPSELTYTGGAVMPITSNLVIYKDEIPSGTSTWPVFRLMDETGHFRDPAKDGYTADSKDSSSSSSIASASIDPSADHLDLNALRMRLQQNHPHFQKELEHSALLHPSPTVFQDTNSKNTLLRAYRHMVRLRQMDKILQNAQRQGRISFYMTCRGEEAIHMGAASALKLEDTVFAQYREAGLLMWRGFTLDQFCNQCFSNDMDLGRGRQMPVHYGCRALNYHTVSSPLGTQLPQAVGAAYRLKLSKQDAIAVCFFGDGCASTTDFHSALNFAATLQVPCVFVCRNNGYAISTPVTDQYASDGIVSRAYGYGMAGIRVDGNDVFAMSAAMREARAYALQHSAPVLLEAMTYRQGHHSTSDDSTRYRPTTEVQEVAIHQDPVQRLKHFLKNEGLMDSKEAAVVRDEEKMAVLKAMEAAERRPKPKLEHLFTNVYEEVPPHLQLQQEQLHAHIQKYPNRY